MMLVAGQLIAARSNMVRCNAERGWLPDGIEISCRRRFGPRASDQLLIAGCSGWW